MIKAAESLVKIISNHFRIIIVLNSIKIIIVNFIGFVDFTKILTWKIEVMDLPNFNDFENYSN
jgi:hypothetical protein